MRATWTGRRSFRSAATLFRVTPAEAMCLLTAVVPHKGFNRDGPTGKA